MLNSLQNGSCSLVFITLLLHTTTSKISAKNLFLYVNFPFLTHSYLFTKSSIQTALTLSFSIRQQFLTSPFLCKTIPAHDKYFPYLSHLSNSGCVIGTRKLESLVTTDTVWISPFFLRVGQQ